MPTRNESTEHAARWRRGHEQDSGCEPGFYDSAAKLIGFRIFGEYADGMPVALCPKISGDDFEEATPDPIPNSVVKLFGADGTAWVAVWESRTSPGLFPKSL